MSAETVRRWPVIEAVVRNDGTGEVRIDGTSYPVVAPSLEEARVEVLRRVTENAVRVGRPVRASAEGPEGIWKLVVHPDGTVVPEEDGPAPSGATAVVADDRAGGAGPAGPGTEAPGAETSYADTFDSGDTFDGETFEPETFDPAEAGRDGADAGFDPEPDLTMPRIPLSPPAVPGDPLDEGSPEELDEAAPGELSAYREAAGPDVDGTEPGDADVTPLRGKASGEDVPLGYVAVEGLTADTDPGGTVPGGSALDTGLDVPAPRGTRDPRPASASSPSSSSPSASRSRSPLSSPSSPSSPSSSSASASASVDRERGIEVTDPFHSETPAVPRTRREARESFLTQVSAEEPAEQGFRGWLTRVGVRIPPSAAERAIRADEREVGQHWPGPRTISIVNGKGGAGKTPSTVLLSAVFAQYGGAGVVAWDNNQTRGTLGWRTEKGPHDATLLDLLPRTDHLLGPQAQAADLARYVHHQTRDRYDVLRSKPMAMANEQRIDPSDVDAIHAVLSKYYRLIVIDSGNDESDPMWQRMIDLTDQLVIATTTRDDHAEAGALLLEGLAERDGRSAYLAQQAVAVVSQADQKAPQAEIRKVAAGYASIAREVVTIPFDPGMVDGHLRYGALRPATKRAWLAAGAAVARGL